jgi:hypothetical protein
MSVALDVVIGVVFLYLLLALVVTTLQELIATVFHFRANNLYDALKELLQGKVKIGSDEKHLVDALYAHPLIKSLCRDIPAPGIASRQRPSYIPSRTFAVALLDVLRGDSALTEAIGASKVITQASTTLALVQNEDLRRTLGLLLDHVKRDGDRIDEEARAISTEVEGWFNNRMARASGWYKRRMQSWAFAIACAVTLVFNADTIYAVNRLWTDSTLRDSIVATAQAYRDARATTAAPPAASAAGAPGSSAEPPTPSASDVRDRAADVVDAAQSLRESGLPIGWQRRVDWSKEWFIVLVGWFLTALAVSLGSGFWFDILSKVLQVRGSGKKVSPVTGRVESSDP